MRKLIVFVLTLIAFAVIGTTQLFSGAAPPNRKERRDSLWTRAETKAESIVTTVTDAVTETVANIQETFCSVSDQFLGILRNDELVVETGASSKGVFHNNSMIQSQRIQLQHTGEEKATGLGRVAKTLVSAFSDKPYTLPDGHMNHAEHCATVITQHRPIAAQGRGSIAQYRLHDTGGVANRHLQDTVGSGRGISESSGVNLTH